MNIIIIYYKKTCRRDNNKLFYILSKNVKFGFAKLIFYIECAFNKLLGPFIKFYVPLYLNLLNINYCIQRKIMR